ncbi:MAG: twin-arginine translocase subunit TatC [Clostridia bacterium]|nr:twin-arginine translocase subunit TatC [Clostridia bacterium]
MIESENIVKAVRWLDKFRARIVVMFLVPILSAVGVYFFSDNILSIISYPLGGETLFFLTPVEGVMAKIKIAFFGGIIVSSPITAYFVVSILASLLEKPTRRKLYFLIIPFATFALLGGIFFGYKFILPTTVKFLISCGDGFMKPMISGSNYVSFITFFLISIGIVFELPLVLVALSRLGLIKAHMLMKKRKVAIMIIFVCLAILTPTPDAFTLVAVCLPMTLLYELSIWWIYVLEKLDRRKAAV